MSPDISVVVPCRGHGRELVACLAALHRQDGDLRPEIIVVDSGPPGDLRTDARVFDAVRVIRSAGPLSPSDARNLGAGQARGGVLAFTDADCVPEQGWLSAAAAALADGAVVVGGPILDARSRHPVAAADYLLAFPDFVPARPRGPIEHLPACNLVVRREAFDAAGGFPSMPSRSGRGTRRVSFVAGEDTLLCQLAIARWPGGVRFDPAVRVAHRGRSGLAAFVRHQEGFGFARGWLRHRLPPMAARHGGRAWFGPAVVARRLGFVLRAAARTGPSALARSILLLPLLVFGLCAWAIGFRRGMRTPPGVSRASRAEGEGR
ncbi:MAG TPA: glycosyltransferase [Gemmatimonadota bacterium]|jgi:glycosyltransferase involved in cell wall biosynthesis